MVLLISFLSLFALQTRKFDVGETTFDLQDTTIIDANTQSGGAFTATMYNTKFVIEIIAISRG